MPNTAEAPEPGKSDRARANLIPWRPGQSGNPGGFPAKYRRIRAAARDWSDQAIQTLGEALSSRDERVRVVAAQALLDRAWGKPKEAKDDDQRQVSVDLSGATTAELQVLLALVQRGALRPLCEAEGHVSIGTT